MTRLPVAHKPDIVGRNASNGAHARSTRAKKEPKLQVAIVRADASEEPYADVPCTD